jgi:hypothetical protein
MGDPYYRTYPAVEGVEVNVPEPVEPTVTITLTAPQFKLVLGELLGKGMFDGAWVKFRYARQELAKAGVTGLVV